MEERNGPMHSFKISILRQLQYQLELGNEAAKLQTLEGVELALFASIA
jgi:hypothetical protein